MNPATDDPQRRIAELEHQVARLQAQVQDGLRQQQKLDGISRHLDDMLFESRLLVEFVALGHRHKDLDGLAVALLDMVCTLSGSPWAVMCLELDGTRIREFSVNPNSLDVAAAQLACRQAIWSQTECAPAGALVYPFGSSERTTGAFAMPATVQRANLELFTFFAFHCALLLERGIYFEGLLEANRLKDEFLQAVSHELRTPLNVVQGFLFLAQHHDPFDSPKTREWLDEATAGGFQLEKVIKELLDYANVLAGRVKVRREAVAIKEMIVETAETLGPMFDSLAQGLVLELPERMAPLWGEAPRVRQILLHLLISASSRAARGARIILNAREQEGELRLEITDDSPVSARRAPDPGAASYQVVDMPGGGIPIRLGLGLVVSRALAEAHGGSVGMRSDSTLSPVLWCHLPTLPQAVAEGSP